MPVIQIQHRALPALFHIPSYQWLSTWMKQAHELKYVVQLEPKEDTAYTLVSKRQCFEEFAGTASFFG